jgi:phosphatidylglycerophosphatase A
MNDGKIPEADSSCELKRVPKLSAALLRDPIHLFALGFGSGLAPKAPGTFGTLAAIPLIMFIAYFGWTAHLVLTIGMCVIGVYICGASATKLRVHDHPSIVWDEFAGFSLTMLGAPMTWLSHLQWLLIGFVLFRFFDIAKPWPIREADHSLKGGLGIMLDDIIAGFFSGAVMYALAWAL